MVLRRSFLRLGASSFTIGSLLMSSLAVASLLPGTPDITSVFNRINKTPTLDSVLNGGSNEVWSERIPGSSSNVPSIDLGGLWGRDLPGSEKILNQAEKIASNYLLCQLVGDFGSLPISIPDLPISQCSNYPRTTANQLPGDVIVPVEGEGSHRSLIATVGTLGPNPFEIRGENPGPPKTVSTYDALTLSPIVRQRDLSNLYDQTLARSTAAPMVGKTGTEWMSNSVQSTSKVIENSQRSAKVIQELAESAKSLSVTQDIVKNSAQMQNLTASMLLDQSILNGKVHASLLGLQQEQAMMLLNQANLSEGIDEMNRRERSDRLIEAASAARLPLYIPGLYPSETSGGQ